MAGPPGSKVIFVGDLVNKGPKSVECVAIARSLGALCVRGNHEIAVLCGAAARQKARKDGDSLDEVAPAYSWTDGLSAEDIEWLTALPYSITLPDHNAIIVHAGLVPGVGLADQGWNDMTRMRDVVETDDGAWEGCTKPKKGFPF